MELQSGLDHEIDIARRQKPVIIAIATINDPPPRNFAGEGKERHGLVIAEQMWRCGGKQGLIERGAAGVVAYVTHGVLSGGAVARVEGSELTELVITDSIQLPDGMGDAKKIRPLTIAPLLGEAIKRIADESSVSSLFD